MAADQSPMLLQAIAIVDKKKHCGPFEGNLNEAWSFFNSDLSCPHAQQRVASMKAALKANSELMLFRFHAAHMCLLIDKFGKDHHVILSPWDMQVFSTAAKIMDSQLEATSLPDVGTLTIDAQSTLLAQSPGVFKELHTQADISEGGGKRAYLTVFGLIQSWLTNRSQAARDDLYYIESSNTRYPQRLHYDRDPKSSESYEEYFLLYFPLSGALWVGGGTGPAKREQIPQNGAFFGHSSRCLHGAAAYPGKNGRLFWQTTTRTEEEEDGERKIFFPKSN